MFEPLDQSEQERQESLPSSSCLRFGKQVYGYGDVFMGYRRLLKRRSNSFPSLVAVASALAVIFLTFHCRLWSVEEASGLAGRRLAEGKGDGSEAGTSSVVPNVCGDTHQALSFLEQGVVPGEPQLPLASGGPEASADEPGEHPAKRLKIESPGERGILPEGKGKSDMIQERLGGIEDWLLRDTSEGTLERPLLVSESSFGKSDGMNDVQQEDVSTIKDGSHDVASAVRTVSSTPEQSGDWLDQSAGPDWIDTNLFDAGSIMDIWPLEVSDVLPAWSSAADAVEDSDYDCRKEDPLQRADPWLVFQLEDDLEGGQHSSLGLSASNAGSVFSHGQSSLISQHLTGMSSEVGKSHSTVDLSDIVPQGADSLITSELGARETMTQAQAFPGSQTPEATSETPLTVATSSPSDLASNVGLTRGKAPAGVVDYRMHLYYHLPEVPQEMKLRQLDTQYEDYPLRCGSLGDCLDPMRRLFVQAGLTIEQVQELIVHTESLLNFVSKKFVKNPRCSKISVILPVCVKRFWVADSLWCACKLAGAAMKREQWWESVFETMLEPLKILKVERRRRTKSGAANAELAHNLRDVLEKYREGERPEASVVVELKKRTLIQGRRGFGFVGDAWDKFRADDRFHCPSQDSSASRCTSADCEQLAQSNNLAAMTSPNFFASNQGKDTVQAAGDVVDYTMHRYYHLPNVPEDMPLRQLNIQYRRQKLQCATLGRCLDPMRRLFVQESLTSEQVEELITHTENLLKYVYARLNKTSLSSKVADTLPASASRFWIADFLWCACKLAGKAMNQAQWWEPVFKRLLEPLKNFEIPNEGTDERETPGEEFARHLYAALKIYREGERPEASVVVTLKRKTLIEGPKGFRFRGAVWDEIRADDRFDFHSPDPAGSSSASTSFLQKALPTGQDLKAVSSPSGLPTILGAGRVQGRVSVVDYRMHRFYHLPAVPQGMKLRQLNTHYENLPLKNRSLVGCLKPMRRLFVKESLTTEQVEELIGHTESLLKFVSSRFGGCPVRSKECDVIPLLAIRLWAADFLWCACELGGQAMRRDDWWNSVLETMHEPLKNWALDETRVGRTSTNGKLANRLYAALQKYMNGKRPEPVEVFAFKFETLFKHRYGFKYQGCDWDEFRADNSFHPQVPNRETSTDSASQS